MNGEWAYLMIIAFVFLAIGGMMLGELLWHLTR